MPTRGVPGAVFDEIRSDLTARGQSPTPRSVAAAVRRGGHLLGDSQLLALTAELETSMQGLGVLQPLVDAPGATDVLVNGPGPAWVDQGQGPRRSEVSFGTETEVRALAQRLASQAGRRLDDGAPWVDAPLPGGIRLHAILPPLAGGGTHISLRVLASRRRLDDLVVSGSLAPCDADLLRRVVAARVSYLVTGGTGCGKTTVLAAMLREVPSNERVLVVEDSPELQIEHPHVVLLRGRPPNVEGRGGVAMSGLVRQALRMRPDRLVVGEVRGTEIADMMAALNSGHEGGCATLHANSPAAVPDRVESLALPAGLSAAAAASQLVTAFSVVVHLARSGSTRWVRDIAVLRRDGRTVCVESALTVDSRGNRTVGPAMADLEAMLEPVW
jgi:pilus assembly protein CpaF